MQQAGIDIKERVSIHAPRFREAMPSKRRRQDERQHVSIHAPRFREAMRSSFAMCGTLIGSFNPRPPFPGGDAFSG